MRIAHCCTHGAAGIVIGIVERCPNCSAESFLGFVRSRCADLCTRHRTNPDYYESHSGSGSRWRNQV